MLTDHLQVPTDLADLGTTNKERDNVSDSRIRENTRHLGRTNMKLDHLEQLAKAVQRGAEHHSILGADTQYAKRQVDFRDAANPATILAMIALLRQMHGALSVANTNLYFKAAVDALAAFDEFNGE